MIVKWYILCIYHFSVLKVNKEESYAGTGESMGKQSGYPAS